MAFVTRFAPSPTGALHLGSAYSALCAFDAAREANGRFLLRIEDTDTTRCSREYEDQLCDDLRWLGLTWEKPARRQSEHFDEYLNALEPLRDAGLIYRCFKTRRQVLEDIGRAPHLTADGPDGPVYIGSPLPAAEEKERIADGEPFAWRLSLKAARDHLGSKWDDLDFVEDGEGPNGETGRIQATPEIFGDAVIGRKDIGASYHLACVYDDALQGVTHVIRGCDLFAVTHLHRLLQELLGLATPRYRHHRLILNEDGKRFAKRDKSSTIRALRAQGVTPQNLRARFL